MDRTIFFSVCRYIPDILRGESINIGIIVHVPQNKFIKFYKTKNLSRIRTFDDEIETEVLKALLESLEYQFDNNRISKTEGIDRNNFLENELVYFINQTQFSPIRVLNSNSEAVNQDIKDLIDTYLYYDKKKSERIPASRVKSLATKMLATSYLKDRIDRNPKVTNNFNQSPFDLSLDIEGNKTLIKAITFDYKNKNKFFNEIKSLMYDVSYVKNMLDSDIKIIINNTDMNEDYEKLAYELLNKEVDVLTLEEFDRFVFENSSSRISSQQLNLFNLS